MTRWRAALCGILLATTASATAWAAQNEDLSLLSNREYVEYVRDRFEWLTGEARSGYRLSSQFHQDCRADAEPNSDAARACEVAKAADEQSERILKEARDLLNGLRERFGDIPPWARGANAQLEKAAHHH